MSEPVAAFDNYAADYEAALGRGLSLSGESRDHFAAGRVSWTARRLAGHSIARILDYGCGTGGAVPHLLATFSAQVVGADISLRSLEQARRDHPRAKFVPQDELADQGQFDLVYCNGVFHHIPPRERPAAWRQVYDSLRPGGWFALWENNPFSPAARWVMWRIPFDRDAIMLWPGQTRKHLERLGFRVRRPEFLFIFPKFLSVCRVWEPSLARLPLGAQYVIFAQKPLASASS